MFQLRLPRLPPQPRAGLPPELRDALTVTQLLLSRREFLKGVAVALAALAAPLTWAGRVSAAARGRFFTRREFQTLEALCARIIPEDGDPGAKELGVPRYIDRLLSAFDRRGTPRIFAGGPFSGRTPFPDNETGTPSRRRPKNDFKRFIVPTRLQELRWRAELFGSEAVPEIAYNDAALGPLRGLRQIYRDGLRGVDTLARTMHRKRYAKLSLEQQDSILGLLSALGGMMPEFAVDPRRGLGFAQLLVRHTLEGCFSAPEYGGNRRGRGWALIGIEGDAHPLGYSIFSRATNSYNERPTHPMSTPNPDELSGGTLTPRPLNPDAVRIRDSISSFAGLFEDAEC
jgi:gluconate 2-dehydrogenase gamma chain